MEVGLELVAAAVEVTVEVAPVDSAAG